MTWQEQEPDLDAGFEVEWQRRPRPAAREPEVEWSEWGDWYGTRAQLSNQREAERPPQSRVAQLQRRVGNAALLQLRARLQRRTFSGAETPQWMKDQVGITAEAERNFEHAQSVARAAEELVVPGGGRTLLPALRAPAEQSLGVSLNDVSIVEGGDAATERVDALAFAAWGGGLSGHAVVLSRDVDLETRDGQFTLMHELAHVAQQKRGEAEGLDGLGGDPSVRDRLEQAADTSAARVLRRMDDSDAEP